MKRPVLLAFAFACIIPAFTQVRVAFLIGGHSASIKEKNTAPGWDSIGGNYSARTGVHIGFMADARITPTSNFYFQPAVIFSTKGRKYSASRDSMYADIDTSYTTKYLDERKQFVNYIDIPLNLVYKSTINTKTKIFLGAGPYLSIFYSGKEENALTLLSIDHVSNTNSDLPLGKKPGQYKVLDYGLNASAGVEFGKVFFRFEFSRGLGEFYTEGPGTSFHHQVIGATLGIYLGKPVEEVIPTKDRDGDGISDDNDGCPDEPGSAITNGCPDRDADGIADKDDQCPDLAGNIKYHGCPIPDTDKDGINDEEDKCPSVPGIAKYQGCPIPDTDNDGVNDEEDKCPTVPGLPRYQGCPVPDTDGDGINDEEDKCPQQAGSRENNGCPEVKKEIIEKVSYAAHRVQFERTRTALTEGSYKVLDEVATILKANPELQLTIEGHTSNTGIYEANMKLSQDRADNVKKYLVSKGIDPNRLRAIGYGPNKPLNSGRTPAEQALNRRVEMIPAN
jgi:outer membrane protein OmpA-like peptidoglycan-associated protein